MNHSNNQLIRLSNDLANINQYIRFFLHISYKFQCNIHIDFKIGAVREPKLTIRVARRRYCAFALFFRFRDIWKHPSGFSPRLTFGDFPVEISRIFRALFDSHPRESLCLTLFQMSKSRNLWRFEAMSQFRSANCDLSIQIADLTMGFMIFSVCLNNKCLSNCDWAMNVSP